MKPHESYDRLAERAIDPQWQWPSGSPPPRQRDDGVELAQVWGIVRDNARLVCAIGGGIFALVMTMCLSSHPSFKSVARLYFGELDTKGQTANNGIDITASNLSEAGSEIEVLRSRSMVRKAILASGLNVEIAPPGWQQPRVWRWLASSRDPALLDVAADQLAAVDTTLADDVVLRRKYHVRFLSDTDYALSGERLAPVRGKLGLALQTTQLSLTLMPGREGPKRGAEFNLVVEPIEETIDRTLEALDVTLPKAGNAADQIRVLTLAFSNPSRRHAAAFLDQLMRGYLEARHTWRTEDASAAEKFVTEQLQSMQKSLDRTQERMAEYRSENRVVVLAAEAEAMVQQVNHFEQQRMDAVLQASSLRSIKRALKNRNTPIEAHLLGETNDVVLQQMAASLTSSREKLSDYDGQYSGIAPELKRQHAQVRDQQGSIRNYVDARLSRTEQNVGALNKVIEDLETKLKTVPGAEFRMAQIGRESEVYSKMYSYLLERQQQAAITKASTVSKNRILDAPQVPLREASPNLVLHLASGIFGLLFGAVLVVMRGLFSGVFRRENDVRVLLGPVQVFARVPSSLPKLRAKYNDEWPAPPLFDLMSTHADAGYAEAFRSLRTNLYRALPGEQGKVILVTSPGAGDGKTTCALSLAAMLAADNRRVLVIDADVRKPSHHALLRVPAEPGLRELILANGAHWRDSIRTLCLSTGWFDSLCAGVGAHAELFSDAYFGQFLTQIRTQYDFIVIDAASYPSVSDPLVLAPLSDFVLSVLRLNSTPRKLAEEHVSGILAGARGYALVVNSVEAANAALPLSEVSPVLSAAFRRLHQ